MTHFRNMYTFVQKVYKCITSCIISYHLVYTLIFRLPALPFKPPRATLCLLKNHLLPFQTRYLERKREWGSGNLPKNPHFRAIKSDCMQIKTTHAKQIRISRWRSKWAWQELNPRPSDYESAALTTWATSPFFGRQQHLQRARCGCLRETRQR